MRIYIQDYVKSGALSRKEKKEYVIEESSTLGELVEEFGYEQYLITVNGCILPDDYVFREGDTVAMLPHLTGG